MESFLLFRAMVNRQQVELRGVKGTIQAIELEDGSGRSFNVRMLRQDGQQQTVYYRAA